MSICFTTVVGNLGTELSLSYQSDECIIVGCGTESAENGYTYTVVNDADTLDAVMQLPKLHTTVVAPRQLYAKYIWHDRIECLPPFDELKEYDFNPEKVSVQQVALALACWIGTPSLFLLGYELGPDMETPALQAFARLYPRTKFAYIRKPNPQKINVFNTYTNVVIDDTETFKQMIKNVVQA
jgi:hypothetical protein